MTKGRPSKYNPKYCNLVIKYMSKGFSKEIVAAKLGISRDTLYEWTRTHDDFSDSIKKGEAKSLYFWEKTGMDGMMGKTKGFNATVWIFVMKNRFRWRDNAPIEPEEVIDIQDRVEEDPQETLARIIRENSKRILIPSEKSSSLVS